MWNSRASKTRDKRRRPRPIVIVTVYCEEASPEEIYQNEQAKCNDRLDRARRSWDSSLLVLDTRTLREHAADVRCLVPDIKFINIPFNSRVVECRIFNSNAYFDIVSVILSRLVFIFCLVLHMCCYSREHALSRSAPKINYLISLSYSAGDCCLDLLSAQLICPVEYQRLVLLINFKV